MRHDNNFIILATPAPISHRTAEENLGIGYLAAVLRKNNYEVEIIDGWLADFTPEQISSRILASKRPLFVGFSVYQSNMDIAIQTINAVKNKKLDIPFIAGGFGPTFNQSDFLNAGFDVTVRGEGEDSLLLLAKHYQDNSISLQEINNISYKNSNGYIVNNPILPLSCNLDDLPYPARDTIKYAMTRRTPIHVLTARGCTGIGLLGL